MSDKYSAGRQVRRTIERHGGRHQGSSVGALGDETASRPLRAEHDATNRAIVGIATCGGGYLAGPSAVAIVGQAEVGWGDYAGTLLADTMALAGFCYVGRGLKRVG